MLSCIYCVDGQRTGEPYLVEREMCRQISLMRCTIPIFRASMPIQLKEGDRIAI